MDCRSIRSIATTCVEYVKGSHRWGRWFQPKFFKQGGVDLQVQDSRFEPLPDLDAERGQHEFLAWDMEPGDVIAFHALTLAWRLGQPLDLAPPPCLGDALVRRRCPLRRARRPDLAAHRRPRAEAGRPARMRDLSQGVVRATTPRFSSTQPERHGGLRSMIVDA